MRRQTIFSVLFTRKISSNATRVSGDNNNSNNDCDGDGKMKILCVAHAF